MIKRKSPGEILASLRDTVEKLEIDEKHLDHKPAHVELKNLLLKRIADLEAQMAAEATYSAKPIKTER